MSFIKGALVRGFGRSGTIEELAWLSPRVLRIGIRGADLTGVAFRVGDKVKIHVGEGLRSYTPSSWDTETGTVEFVVHVHGDSAASRWARDLAAGDTVRLMGPARSVDGVVDAAPPWAAFYGDETTIGLVEAIAEALPAGTPLLGAVEVHGGDLAATGHLPIDGVTRNGTHGPALVQHLAQAPLPDGEGIVWLSGEAGSVLALRKALLDRGLERRQLRIKPYWSRKGKAHRKQLERTVLRA